jgi:hypothetical protein
MRGSKETEVNEFAVKPIASPLLSIVVTTATPVANTPSAFL